MSEANAPTTPSLYLTAGLAGGAALVFAILLYLATGATLGLYFGGVMLVTLLLPPLVLCERPLLRQAIAASAVNDAVGLVWLVAVIASPTTLLQWLLSYLLLASYSFALWGLVRVIRSLGVAAIPASALSITIAALWLASPIWLAQHVSPELVDWLVRPHPLLSLNGLLSHLGIWSEQAIAYRHLLTLGQDIAYSLPQNIVAAVFVHLIAGGTFLAIASARSDG